MITELDKQLGFYCENEVANFDEWAIAAFNIMSAIRKTEIKNTRLQVRYVSYTSAYFIACLRLLVEISDDEATVSIVGTRGLVEIVTPRAYIFDLVVALDFLVQSLINLTKSAVKAQRAVWKKEALDSGLTLRQAKQAGLIHNTSIKLYNSFYLQAFEALAKKIIEN